jgi:outer membrane assembly lipoprotein YfiO
METTPRRAGNTGMTRRRLHVRLNRRLLTTLLLLLAGGCSSNRENINLLGPDDLYTRGVESYEARRFERAIVYLDYFVAQYVGDPRAVDARMLLGEAHMARREYATAASHFQRVISDYPTSPRNREARFKICESYFRLSPAPPLDQEYTVSALQHCESVAEYFPATVEGDSAQAHVEELREKMARKSYDAGMHYFRRRRTTRRWCTSRRS